MLNNVKRQIWNGYCPVVAEQGLGEDLEMLGLFCALIMGLECILSNVSNTHSFTIEGNSQLFINRINNGYRGKEWTNSYDKVIALMDQIGCPNAMIFNCIAERDNGRADILAGFGACSDKPFIMDYLKFIDK